MHARQEGTPRVSTIFANLSLNPLLIFTEIHNAWRASDSGSELRTQPAAEQVQGKMRRSFVSIGDVVHV
jgi:hypothetical protein